MVSLSQSDTYCNRKKEVINITPKGLTLKIVLWFLKLVLTETSNFGILKHAKYLLLENQKRIKKKTQMLYEFQRNGADFSVFVNTAAEFDGSDAGASPDEAVSWGKIKKTAKPVKVSRRCLFIPKQMNSSSTNTMYWLEMEIEALTYQLSSK